MTTSMPSRSRAEADRREREWASGFAVFAGLMMIIGGVNQALLGLAGVLQDDVYVPVQEYVYGFDLTTWGWVHLGFGLVLVLTGVSVLGGKAWARAVGIWVVMLNLVASFAFIPHYPVWAVLLIALNVAVIWGLARYEGDLRRPGSSRRNR
jgi:hypothetical protein